MTTSTIGRTVPREKPLALDPLDNHVLAALPESDRARLTALADQVTLVEGDSIYEADSPIELAYFPVAGLVSMVSSMERGTVEVGTVGREGMTGLPLVLRADRMATRAFVQIPGAALRLPASVVREELDRHGALEAVLFRYAQVLFDDVAQAVACNRLHTLEERCARWLLMTQDRIGQEVLPLKQVFLAQMLGVHRPAVTLAAGALQQAGLITYTRGRVTIVNREGLESAACPCYGVMRKGLNRLRPS